MVWLYIRPLHDKIDKVDKEIGDSTKIHSQYHSVVNQAQLTILNLRPAIALFTNPDLSDEPDPEDPSTVYHTPKTSEQWLKLFKECKDTVFLALVGLERAFARLDDYNNVNFSRMETWIFLESSAENYYSYLEEAAQKLKQGYSVE